MHLHFSPPPLPPRQMDTEKQSAEPTAPDNDVQRAVDHAGTTRSHAPLPSNVTNALLCTCVCYTVPASGLTQPMSFLAHATTGRHKCLRQGSCIVIQMPFAAERSFVSHCSFIHTHQQPCQHLHSRTRRS